MRITNKNSDWVKDYFYRILPQCLECCFCHIDNLENYNHLLDMAEQSNCLEFGCISKEVCSLKMQYHYEFKKRKFKTL